jgi:precorrin-2 dehydrogenase/sirohydrochlorin ferrochelatase
MSRKTAVVIGGGKIACRKAEALLAAGAEVSVVAPCVVEEIRSLALAGKLTVRCGNYETSDLEGVFLVVAATDNSTVNQKVAADAGSQMKLVCVVDVSEVGNCSFPAILRRGNLEIGVSTGGGCPSLALELRDLIATLITEEYGTIAGQLSEEREKLLTAGNSSSYNARVIRSLASRLIPELNNSKDTA